MSIDLWPLLPILTVALIVYWDVIRLRRRGFDIRSIAVPALFAFVSGALRMLDTMLFESVPVIGIVVPLVIYFSWRARRVRRVTQLSSTPLTGFRFADVVLLLLLALFVIPMVSMFLTLLLIGLFLY